MTVYIVIYQSLNGEVDILDVYQNEEKANQRVKYERSLIESDPNETLHDECWYQERELI